MRKRLSLVTGHWLRRTLAFAVTGQTGFTFVEVLVALGTLALLMTLVGALMLQSLYVTEDIKARTALHSDTMQVLQGMVRELREARQISIAPEGHELKMVDTKGKIIRYRFDEERENIYRTAVGSVERPLFAERIEVKACVFSGQPWLVSIILTTRTRLPQRRETVSLTLSMKVHTKA